MNNSTTVTSILQDPAVIRRRHWRMIKDKIVRHSMTVGGISVIIAVVLIFFYLFYVVLPLFVPASIKQIQQFSMPAPAAGPSLYLAIEEKNEIAARFTDKGHIVFFRLQEGSVIADNALPIPPHTQITSFAVADPSTNVVAFGLSDGRALVVKHAYKITFPNDQRVITPQLEYPLGEEPFIVDEQGQALKHLDVQLSEDANTLVAVTADNRLVLAGVTKEVNFLDDSTTLERVGGSLSLNDAQVRQLLLEKEQQVLYLVDKEERIWYIDIHDKAVPNIRHQVRVVEPDQQITTVKFLTGDISLLVGDSSGGISQWFLVRDDNNNQVLTEIRSFNEQNAAIVDITPEERRKGFIAADDQGYIGIYHATAHRTLAVKSITEANLKVIALSPRANTLITEDTQGQFQVFSIHNEHPEVSWSALWSKVWYENHEQPKYLWQSSSASSDFEPKFSLTPLAFGTLKAAFYAMLIAIPLAIFGAIYTAYFMTPGLRQVVKPTIEIMEALPTVILGFLAGLWLAPVIELNLPGVFSLIILMPLAVLSFAYLWQRLPQRWTCRIPEDSQAALLIPVVLFTGWLAFALSPQLEAWLFDGNMRQWLTNMGIDFDQRNALVVGMTMGLAVIPSIFSITEDAIFSVPKHLTTGSLALGATRWQTMLRVVILTASPGIFSAVMIGMGRAVGETMIVLMATGNTAVMDFSIFEGLRTLSANIAVEMPESEVNSTHYRILFLSGLVLFLFTFFFNTMAEIVRQRLRRKYSSL